MQVTRKKKHRIDMAKELIEVKRKQLQLENFSGQRNRPTARIFMHHLTHAPPPPPANF